VRRFSAFLTLIAALMPLCEMPAQASRCTGDAYCNACKNCNYCGNCNSGGHKCGVYYASRGLSGPQVKEPTHVEPTFTVVAGPGITPTHPRTFNLIKPLNAEAAKQKKQLEKDGYRLDMDLIVAHCHGQPITLQDLMNTMIKPAPKVAPQSIASSVESNVTTQDIIPVAPSRFAQRIKREDHY